MGTLMSLTSAIANSTIDIRAGRRDSRVINLSALIISSDFITVIIPVVCPLGFRVGVIVPFSMSNAWMCVTFIRMTYESCEGARILQQWNESFF
jgi:hypothetical protein